MYRTTFYQCWLSIVSVISSDRLKLFKAVSLVFTRQMLLIISKCRLPIIGTFFSYACVTLSAWLLDPLLKLIFLVPVRTISCRSVACACERASDITKGQARTLTCYYSPSLQQPIITHRSSLYCNMAVVIAAISAFRGWQKCFRCLLEIKNEPPVRGVGDLECIPCASGYMGCRWSGVYPLCEWIHGV